MGGLGRGGARSAWPRDRPRRRPDATSTPSTSPGSATATRPSCSPTSATRAGSACSRPGTPTNSVDGAAGGTAGTRPGHVVAACSPAGRRHRPPTSRLALTGDPTARQRCPAADRAAPRAGRRRWSPALWPALWGFAAGRRLGDRAARPRAGAWAGQRYVPGGPVPDAAGRAAALRPAAATALAGWRARRRRPAARGGPDRGRCSTLRRRCAPGAARPAGTRRRARRRAAARPDRRHRRRQPASATGGPGRSSCGGSRCWLGDRLSVARRSTQAWRHRLRTRSPTSSGCDPARRYGARGHAAPRQLPLVVPPGLAAGDRRRAAAPAGRRRAASTRAVRRHRQPRAARSSAVRGDSLLLRLAIRSLQVLDRRRRPGRGRHAARLDPSRSPAPTPSPAGWRPGSRTVERRSTCSGHDRGRAVPGG